MANIVSYEFTVKFTVPAKESDRHIDMYEQSAARPDANGPKQKRMSSFADILRDVVYHEGGLDGDFLVTDVEAVKEMKPYTVVAIDDENASQTLHIQATDPEHALQVAQEIVRDSPRSPEEDAQPYTIVAIFAGRLKSEIG